MLFPEQREDQGEDIVGYDLVAFGGGVGVVALHHAVYAEDSFEKEGQKGDVVFLGDEGVGLIELLDVVGTVVGWKGDARQSDLGAAGLEGGDDLVEISAGVFDAKATEAVVSTEFDDDDGWFEGEDVVDAFYSVFGGVAADAFVDDSVVVASGVEVGLEEVGVALAEFSAVAGG